MNLAVLHISYHRKPSAPEVAIQIQPTKVHQRASRSRSYNVDAADGHRIIKCQRINTEKTLEEIEISVPFCVYKKLAL